MSFLNRIRAVAARDAPNDPPATSTAQDAEMQVNTNAANNNKEIGVVVPDDMPDDKIPEESVPARDAQIGVQKIEAVTLAWTKKWLAALLFK